MEQLLELLFSGGLNLSAFTDDLLALDRSMSKSDFLALLVLDRRGQATMSELATDLGAPLSTVTGIAARLAQRKLLVRERDPQDRRAIIARLTPTGQALAARAKQQVSQLLGRVQAALSPEEIELALGLVRKIWAALAQPTARAATGAAGHERRKIPIED